MKNIEQIEPLLSLIEDESITEIVINNESDIFYERHGQFYDSQLHFVDKQSYRLFVQRLCQRAKIQFDFNSPFADGYLHPFRINLVAPPLSAHVQITLRRHKEVPWSLKELQDIHWAPPPQIQLIQRLVHNHDNILVIGATGTGKTSCLNALLQELPSSERVIIIEDTQELRLPNRLSLRLLTRHDLHGHLRTYTQEDLLKQALRMRPQRIVLGEVRGREAKDFLLTLSTGHRGALCSLHAEDPKQALLRLEMLVKMGAPEWDTSIVKNLIYLSLNYVLTLENSIHGKRKLKSLHKVAGLESHGITLSRIF